MTHNSNGQTANELRLEAEFNEIASLRMSENFFRRLQRQFFCRKADGGFSQTLADDFLQAAKGATDDKQNMFGVNGARRFSASLGEIHHCLDLTRNIIR